MSLQPVSGRSRVLISAATVAVVIAAAVAAIPVAAAVGVAAADVAAVVEVVQLGAEDHPVQNAVPENKRSGLITLLCFADSNQHKGVKNN